MPLRVTAHSGYINIVHCLCQASHVLRCVIPFRMDVQQVSVSQVFQASAGGRRYVAPKQEGSVIAALQDQRDMVKPLCGSRTEANEDNHDGMALLRTIVLQRLEDMMATCNHLELLESLLANHLTSWSLAVWM